MSHTASIALARFFLESGWFDASEKILSRTARALEGERSVKKTMIFSSICHKNWVHVHLLILYRSAESLKMLFTTHTHLLSAYISNCLFEKAQTTFNEVHSSSLPIPPSVNRLPLPSNTAAQFQVSKRLFLDYIIYDSQYRHFPNIGVFYSPESVSIEVSTVAKFLSIICRRLPG